MPVNRRKDTPRVPRHGRLDAILTGSGFRGKKGPTDSPTVSVISFLFKGLALRPSWDIPRRFVLALTLTTLAACGFTPAYGPNGTSENLRGSILVDRPENRTEFVFVSHLEQRLGQPQSAPYELTYLITTSSQGLGVTPEQSTTRYNVSGRIDFIVKDIAADQVAHRGSVETFTGYSATGSIIGAPSAEEDARDRLMVALADQIVTELIATAPDWKR